MGTTIKTEMDFDTFKKLISKKPNCKECGTKLKINKEKVFKYHGNSENENHIMQNELGPISMKRSKEVYLNQDVYEIEYKYKCPKCNHISDLNNIEN